MHVDGGCSPSTQHILEPNFIKLRVEGQGVYVKEAEWDKYSNGNSIATSSITKKLERTGGKRTRGQFKAAVQG